MPIRVWQFTEQPYPAAWDADPVSLRVTLPNRHFDPVLGADLINRYLDEWALGDELGLDIMVNEHHSTATCISPSCTMTLAMLAKATKRARLLTLGIPLCNRPDPVRIAEEMSYIDVVSRGRVEMGLVKGVPYEISPANSNPSRMMDRFWEAHDLILKAMTTTDGPFNWEGEYFHYRQVNIWPRPYQQPRPNVWISAGSPQSAIPIAERGHTAATVLSRNNARNLYHTYRMRAAELGRDAPADDRFAYLALVAVGDNQAEAFSRLAHIRGYLESTNIVAPQFANPPGYSSPQANAKALASMAGGRASGDHLKVVTSDGRHINQATAPHEDLIDGGVAFAGTPDQVVAQIKAFNDFVGGFGNIVMMGHGGTLPHDETVKNLSLFANEVLPQIQDLKPQRSNLDDQIDTTRQNAIKNAS